MCVYVYNVLVVLCRYCDVRYVCVCVGVNVCICDSGLLFAVRVRRSRSIINIQRGILNFIFTCVNQFRSQLIDAKLFP